MTADPAPRAWALVRLAVRRPAVTIALVLLAVTAAAAGLPRLELRLDGRALLAHDHPVLAVDREVREGFGVHDLLMVTVETTHPEGIYNLATLRRLARISRTVAAMPGIGAEQVTSLATERRDRVYPGTLRFRPFLDPLPDTPVLMEHLRGDVAAVGLLEGTLVSHDGKAAAVLVEVPEVGAAGSVDRARLYEQVVAAVAPLSTATDTVRVVGAPAAESLLGHHIQADLAVLLPVIMLVLAVILAWRLRSLWGASLALAEVGACLLFTFGLMGWLGVPVYLTTGILPIVLTALALADEVHVFSYYQWLLARREDGEPATGEGLALRTMAAMGRPVLLTSLTTMVGFLSFAVAGIVSLRVFGVFAAVGIGFALLWTLTLVPAALVLLGPQRLARRGRRGTAAAAARPVTWGEGLLRHRRTVLAALAVLTLVLGLGATRVYVQDSWVDGFAPGSDFRQATERVSGQFHGTHRLLVQLSVASDGRELPQGDGRSGRLLDPALLAEIGAFEDHLRGLPGVGGVLGPHNQLSAVAYLWLGRAPEARSIPETPLLVSRVLRFFDIVRGAHHRREVVNDDLDEALVMVFLKAANYREVRELQEAIRAYEAAHLAEHGVRVELAGDVALSQAMIPAIVESQVSSLLLALAGIGLVLVVLLRSLREALRALTPVALAVLWTFGVLGWLGIPLGVATSMFCAITLGVGVDYSIHFLEGLRRARAAGDPRPVLGALDQAAPPIVTDLLAVAGSFALMLTSQVPANARLGLLLAVALASSALLTLAGLGAWLGREPQLAARPTDRETAQPVPTPRSPLPLPRG